MKPSHTDQPRRSPVAFLWKRSSDPAALFAICFLSVRLSCGQHEPLDSLAAIQVHHRAEQLSLLVGTARVDAQRVPDAGVPLGLVDMPVQREGRLSLLYRIPHRRRSDGYDRTPAVLGAQILGQLRGVVEAGSVGRTVEVVDGLLGRGRHMRSHLLQPLGEVVFILFAIRIPGRAVRPPGRDHLEVAELDDLTLGEAHALGGGDDFIHLELVVVAGGDEALDVGAFELLVGHMHPALDSPEHLLIEELVAHVLVRLELAHLVRIGPERVVAASLDRVLELLYLVLALEFAPVLQERRVPAPFTFLDYGDERLARHVAAEDHDVRLVVLARIQELAPAGLRAVDVRGEEHPGIGFPRKEFGDHGPPSTSSGSSYRRLRWPIFQPKILALTSPTLMLSLHLSPDSVAPSTYSLACYS